MTKTPLFDLAFLFEFQSVIMEMQGKIMEARLKGATEQTLQPSIERVDKLIEIYSNFDSFYYSAHFARQKNLELYHNISVLADKIRGLKDENKKLLDSLEWKP